MDEPGPVLVTGGEPSTVDVGELGVLRGRVLLAAGSADRAVEHARAAVGALLELFLRLVPESLDTRDRLHVALGAADGLLALAGRLEDLAGDLLLQEQWYAEAERVVASGFDPPSWRLLQAVVPPMLMPWWLSGGLLAADGLRLTGHAVTAAQRLEAAGPGQDGLPALTAQHHTAAFAAYAQYLPRTTRFGAVPVGGRLVDVTAMTPVQRTATGVLPLAEDVGAVLRGGRTYPGIEVRPAAPPHPLPPAEQPRGPADALARIDALEARIRATGVGAVEVLRHTAADGGRSFTVVVPGTQSVDVGGRNPMDNATNLRAMAGLPTDVGAAVLLALARSGAGPRDAVGLVGHSQGGLVAARLAEDPQVRERHRIATVLTAGSPVGGVRVPSAVGILSLENVRDVTVGLDGAPNPATRNHVTVGLDGGTDRPHAVGTYVEAAARLREVDDAGVRGWLERDRAARGAAVLPGARTESFVYDVERTR